MIVRGLQKIVLSSRESVVFYAGCSVSWKVEMLYCALRAKCGSSARDVFRLVAWFALLSRALHRTMVETDGECDGRMVRFDSLVGRVNNPAIDQVNSQDNAFAVEGSCTPSRKSRSVSQAQRSATVLPWWQLILRGEEQDGSRKCAVTWK